MSRHGTIYRLCTLLVCLSIPLQATADAAQNELITLTSPADIHDAVAMNKAIDALSDKVMNCVKEKIVAPAECACHYPQDLAHAKKVYQDTLKKHPAWADKVIFWWSDESQSYS